MNIQGMGQNFAVTNTNKYNTAGKSQVSAYQQTDAVKTSSGGQAEQTIDMNSISPNQYNALVRSGVADLAVPMVLPGGRVHLDGQQAQMGDVKTDYIGQIKQSIEFSESIGDVGQVDFLKERLAVVRALHGQSYMPSEASEGLNITA
ncbi:hypothetical protein L1285_15850 [Pseudoalteromonas sp. DL2-H2.2]|uniref:hypothetical protein n=1 Tax=Pseudoalteromonas sp. DL2-H2.2 TaxID=2908889 RepID=UPI001F21A855|nr:hypothetical protein [Pseudoalteromonas sp. DL2-H2.2]MCF2909800.1 hypothetical protein [Pseudoalteromonas sp. DL2-H2.2]